MPKRPKAPRTIECSQCKGSGAMPMPTQYLETLDALEHEWKATADVLAKLSTPIAPTALINRLAWLERHGLASSRVKPDNMRVKEWKRL